MAQEYIYVDDEGVEQGPYTNDQMIEWISAGYFKLDRKVKIVGESVFQCISDIPQLLMVEEQLLEEEQQPLVTVVSDGLEKFHDTDPMKPETPYEKHVSEYYQKFYRDHYAGLSKQLKNAPPPPQSILGQPPVASGGQQQKHHQQQQQYQQQQYQHQQGVIGQPHVAPVAGGGASILGAPPQQQYGAPPSDGLLGAAPNDGYVVPQVEYKEYIQRGKFDKHKGRMTGEGHGGEEYWAARGIHSHKADRQMALYYDVDAFQRAQEEGLVEGNGPDPERRKRRKQEAEEQGGAHLPAWMRDGDPLADERPRRN